MYKIFRNIVLYLVNRINLFFLPKKYIFFFHVPRTGGTSIKHFISHHYGRNAWIEKSGKPNFPKLFIDPKDKLNNIRIFTGHLQYTELNEEKSTLTFTILRNPIDRLASLYFYLKNFHIDRGVPKQQNSLVVERNLSFEGLVSFLGEKLHDNFYTRFYSNKLHPKLLYDHDIKLIKDIDKYKVTESDYLRAIKNLEKIKVFILEKFDSKDLAKFLNTKIFIRSFHHNISIKDRQISKDEINKVEAINPFDIRLYDHFNLKK